MTTWILRTTEASPWKIFSWMHLNISIDWPTMLYRKGQFSERIVNADNLIEDYSQDGCAVTRTVGSNWFITIDL